MHQNLLPTKILQKAVVVDSQMNLLGLKRTKNYPGGVRPGKWDLPGGSLDTQDLNAEHPHIHAILRELHEETGITDSSSVEVVFIDTISRKIDDQMVVTVAIGYQIMIDKLSPEIVLSSEHSEYRWFSKTDLLNQDFGDDGGFHKEIIASVLGNKNTLN